MVIACKCSIWDHNGVRVQISEVPLYMHTNDQHVDLDRDLDKSDVGILQKNIFYFDEVTGVLKNSYLAGGDRINTSSEGGGGVGGRDGMRHAYNIACFLLCRGVGCDHTVMVTHISRCIR